MIMVKLVGSLVMKLGMDGECLGIHLNLVPCISTCHVDGRERFLCAHLKNEEIRGWDNHQWWAVENPWMKGWVDC